MRILITGDRNWTDFERINSVLHGMFDLGDTMIHGAARGADYLAGQFAAEEGITVEAYPADWEHFGKAAGVLRNQQMLDTGVVALVIAFHNDLASSKGTRDMVRRSLKAGVDVILVTQTDIREIDKA